MSTVAAEKKTTWKRTVQMFHWIYPFLAPHKADLGIQVVASLLMAATATVNIFLMRYVLDSLIQKADAKNLWVAFGVFAGSMAFRSVGQYYTKQRQQKLKNKLDLGMKVKLFETLQVLPFSFFVQSRLGQLVNQMNNQTYIVVRGFEVTIVLVQDLIMIPFLFYTALKMNVFFTVVAVFAYIPTVIIVRRLASEKVEKMFSDLQHISGVVNHKLIEAVNGLRVIRTYQGEKEMVEKYRKIGEEVSNKTIETFTANTSVMMVFDVMNIVGVGVMYFLGGRDILAGKMSVGSLMACISAIGSLNAPLNRIAAIQSDLLQMFAVADRLFGTINAKRVNLDEGDVTLKEKPKEITFKDVSFKYVNNEDTRDVLKNVSFTLRCGEVAAVLGPNGVGKSTLLNLIPRFYETSSGMIEVDGVDIRRIKLSSLRSHIAMVSQDMFMFDGTIYENIQFAKPSATREEVERASKLAQADDFIQKLPKKYETPVGERGSMLSEGQKQRIAIARAFLKDARIVILDEPTSALDVGSKEAISNTLRELMNDRIVFVVTHQTGILPRDARVLTLENGELVEKPHVVRETAS